MSKTPDRSGSHVRSSSAKLADDKERKSKHGSHTQASVSKQTLAVPQSLSATPERTDRELRQSAKKLSKKGSRVEKSKTASPERRHRSESRRATFAAIESSKSPTEATGEHPPPPPTARTPDSAVRSSKRMSTRNLSDEGEAKEKRRSSKKDKKLSTKSGSRVQSPVEAALINDHLAPEDVVSVFVVSDHSLFALRLYFFLAEKGRAYVEAPVPEPEWLAKHTSELVGVAFGESAATASLPSMRLIEKAYPEPALFPQEHNCPYLWAAITEENLEELIDFLDQELTASVTSVLMSNSSAGLRARLSAAFQHLESLLATSAKSAPTSSAPRSPTYLLSSGFSVADILAAVCISALPQLFYFRAFELPPMPNLEKYRTTLFARPALSRTNYGTQEWHTALRRVIPRLPITSYNTFQHVALRALYTQLTDYVAAQKGQWTQQTICTLQALWYRFESFLAAHTKVEEEILFPALEAFAPGCVHSSDVDGVAHRDLTRQLRSASHRVKALSSTLPASPSATLAPGPKWHQSILPELLAFKDASLRHMLGEEKQITPVLAAESERNPSRVQALMERMARASSPSEMWLLLPLVLTSLDLPAAEQYLFNLKILLPPSELYVALSISERTLPEHLWDALQQRCDFLPSPFSVPQFRPSRGSARVLILGVHTPVGESLLRLLLQHSPFAFRVVLHEGSVPSELTGLPSAGVQIAKIDIRDTASLAAVFWGVERLFLSLSSRSASNLPRILAAATAAGVKHIVAVRTNTPSEADRDALARGLRSTVLQPECFFSSLLSALPAAKQDGRLRLPLGVDARIAPMSEADVAEMAMHALAAPPPDESVKYSLAGDVLSPANIATSFGEYLGRRVRFDQEDESTWVAESTLRHGDAETEALTALWQRANRCGEKEVAKLAECTQTAHRLLDREPTTLATHLASVGM